jgi:hypothetical protein
MRRLLNIAEREGWILRNPMRNGDPLISIADERKRERIVTREEELACSPPARIATENIYDRS